MKSLLILSTIICSQLIPGKKNFTEFIDPTGTYILKGEVQKNRIMGHSGEIRVKLLDQNKVALCFYINDGYPDYNAASFMDTLPYEDNTARYNTNPGSGCTLLFFFSYLDAEIEQTYSDPVAGCSFGKGIVVSAFFKRTSYDKPIIQDLSTHGVNP